MSPEPDECIYLAMPISTEFKVADAVAVLTRTPATLNALLRGLPDIWIRSNEGGDSWTPFEVVGHLVHGERTDWIPRARIILEHGEQRTFDRFDRFGQFKENREQSLDQLLDEFSRLRNENLTTLQSLKLQPADFNRRGTHPALGSVTLAELLATWATHDLTHLHQLSRVMAYQYRDAVGPWSTFLGVLQCSGHSAP